MAATVKTLAAAAAKGLANQQQAQDAARATSAAIAAQRGDTGRVQPSPPGGQNEGNQ